MYHGPRILKFWSIPVGIALVLILGCSGDVSQQDPEVRVSPPDGVDTAMETGRSPQVTEEATPQRQFPRMPGQGGLREAPQSYPSLPEREERTRVEGHRRWFKDPNGRYILGVIPESGLIDGQIWPENLQAERITEVHQSEEGTVWIKTEGVTIDDPYLSLRIADGDGNTLPVVRAGRNDPKLQGSDFQVILSSSDLDRLKTFSQRIYFDASIIRPHVIEAPLIPLYVQESLAYESPAEPHMVPQVLGGFAPGIPYTPSPTQLYTIAFHEADRERLSYIKFIAAGFEPVPESPVPEAMMWAAFDIVGEGPIHLWVEDDPDSTVPYGDLLTNSIENAEYSLGTLAVVASDNYRVDLPESLQLPPDIEQVLGDAVVGYPRFEAPRESPKIRIFQATNDGEEILATLPELGFGMPAHPLSQMSVEDPQLIREMAEQPIPAIWVDPQRDMLYFFDPDTREAFQIDQAQLFTERCRIRGVVRYAETGQPVPYVDVTLSGDLSMTVSTGESGTYLFQRLPPGNYTISASRRLMEITPEVIEVNNLREIHNAPDFEARVIRQVPSREEIQALVDAIDSDDSVERNRAIVFLAMYQDPRVVPILMDRLEEAENIYQILFATRHLSTATGENFQTAEEWQSWWRRNRDQYLRED